LGNGENTEPCISSILPEATAQDDVDGAIYASVVSISYTEPETSVGRRVRNDGSFTRWHRTGRRRQTVDVMGGVLAAGAG